MNVAELIEQLGKLDPRLTVVCYTEDETVAIQGISVFEIDAVDEHECQTSRDHDGTVRMRFEGGRGSTKLAVIDITCEI
jgi:hypothetical protein